MRANQGKDVQHRCGSALVSLDMERREGAAALVSLKWSAERVEEQQLPQHLSSALRSGGASAAPAATEACRCMNGTAALASLEEKWSLSGAYGCTPALQQMQPCSLLLTIETL